MRSMQTVFLGLFLTACAGAKVETSDPIQGRLNPAQYRDESLCNLRSRADELGLWGDLVRIEGQYQTDRQTYGWIKAQCKAGELGGIQFTRIISLDVPGLEAMADGERARCGESAFCAYTARVVVVGRLSKDETSMYGILLEPVEVQVFDVLK